MDIPAPQFYISLYMLNSILQRAMMPPATSCMGYGVSLPMGYSVSVQLRGRLPTGAASPGKLDEPASVKCLSFLAESVLIVERLS